MPPSIVDATDTVLREAGRDALEAFVFWSGVLDGTTFLVRTRHVPRQWSARGEGGAHVRIDGRDIHELSLWLQVHAEVIGVQVHSHPREAYHSEADDARAIASKRGALSIVVPDFGAAGLRNASLALLRLGEGGWSEVPRDDRHALLVLESAAWR